MPRKKNRQPPPPTATPNVCCKSCQKYHLKLSKCSRCKDAFYCSADCQKKDWVNHKHVCKPKTSEQQSPDPPAAPPPPDKKESCSSCGESSAKLSTCARCHEAKYCSKECQKAAWPKHKVDCKKNSNLSSEKDRFNTYADEFLRNMYSPERDRFSSHADEFLRNKNFPVKVPDNVLQIARKRYPGFQLITTFFDVYPIDCGLDSVQVLVALMHGDRVHLFRPSMMLRDENEELLRLIFYLDDDEKPDPLKWSKFTVGNYICIPYPEIHYFLDGTEGFRVESVSLVSFIERAT